MTHKLRALPSSFSLYLPKKKKKNHLLHCRTCSYLSTNLAFQASITNKQDLDTWSPPLQAAFFLWILSALRQSASERGLGLWVPDLHSSMFSAGHLHRFFCRVHRGTQSQSFPRPFLSTQYAGTGLLDFWSIQSFEVQTFCRCCCRWLWWNALWDILLSSVDTKSRLIDTWQIGRSK